MTIGTGDCWIDGWCIHRSSTLRNRAITLGEEMLARLSTGQDAQSRQVTHITFALTHKASRLVWLPPPQDTRVGPRPRPTVRAAPYPSPSTQGRRHDAPRTQS